MSILTRKRIKFCDPASWKNMIAEVLHEVDRNLGKPNHADYTFQSFRR